MIDEKTLGSSLKRLGRTRRGAATILKRKGVTGIPEDPQCCVIAEYLRGEFPDEHITVLPSSITVNGANVDTPPHLTDLTNTFDMKDEPQLLRHGSSCDGVVRLEIEDMHGGAKWYSAKCDCGVAERDWSSDEVEDAAKIAAAYVAKANGGKA